MFAAFRRLSKSALGSILTILFLLMIAASFALADLSNVGSGTLGGSSGALATIGDEQVTDREMSNAMRRALEQARQQNPEATYATIADQFEPMLNSMIEEKALLAFASDHGFILSKRLVDAEIAKLPATRGLDGRFSEQAYAAFLQQQQMTDGELRQLLRTAMTQRLVLAPAVVDARVPLGVARPYASMLLEEREGQFALIPTELFRAGLDPSDGDLQSFYAQNRTRYMVPEQRVLRMAKLGPDLVANVAPTDAEIAAYYQENRAQYAGSEKRVISQAVVQDKAAADAIASRARGGAAFAAAAAPAGLSAADVSVGPQSQAEFSNLAGEAIARAAFGAAKGAIVGPLRSDLGWHVIKIDDIQGASGRSLAQARDEIAALLAANKKKDALTELVADVEDQIAEGASFAEATAAAKLQVTTTPAINANGQARGEPGYQFPADLAPVLKAGFVMAADEPEVVTLEGDAGYVLVGVERIIEAAPAPLAQIRDRVREDWIQRKANERAQAVASGIAKKVAAGASLEKATAEAGVDLPAVRPVKAQRIQISQATEEAAAPLRMLFSLTQGKSRMVADPRGRGFFVVKTDKITPHDASTSPTLIARTQAEFQSAVSDELAMQMITAMKLDQGVERDEKAIAASRQRITGGGQ
ncbi:MAG: peptidyl-prolyl cis-trans isomerase [Sphingomonas sp.]|nr:peptidyl-prolyl cis-trans isomerase [Sphingomonas sp.]